MKHTIHTCARLFFDGVGGDDGDGGIASSGAAQAATHVGGKASGFSGGGALGAIVLGASAGRLWPLDAKKAVQANVNEAWALLQPALFRVELLGRA